MDNTVDNNNQIKKKRDCSGARNNFFNHRHSLQSRQKMAASHRAYQEKLRQAKQQTPMTMQDFLSNTPQLDFKGYIESLMKEDILIKIIREEIQKLQL